MKTEFNLKEIELLKNILVILIVCRIGGIQDCQKLSYFICQGRLKYYEDHTWLYDILLELTNNVLNSSLIEATEADKSEIEALKEKLFNTLTHAL